MVVIQRPKQLVLKPFGEDDDVVSAPAGVVINVIAVTR
jgi:hypothetical protein